MLYYVKHVLLPLTGGQKNTTLIHRINRLNAPRTTYQTSGAEMERETAGQQPSDKEK